MVDIKAEAKKTNKDTTKQKHTYLNLRAAIDKSDCQKVKEILESNPKLLRQPKPNQNPLKYACLSNKPALVTLMLKLSLPTYNPHIDQSINDSIIQCIRFELLPMVKLFVECGFNLNNVVFTKKGQILTCIDFAILGGHYEIAYYIYHKIDPLLKNIRNTKQYELLGKKYQYRYVNYQMVIDGLANNIPPESIANYLRKELSEKKKEEIRRIHHEGCWQWLMRMLGIGYKKGKEKDKGKKMVDSGGSNYPKRGSEQPVLETKEEKYVHPPSDKLETSRPMTTQQSEE